MTQLLLLDNRDSFVWNLAQSLQRRGAAVHVVRSDAITVAEIEAMRPRALLLSPGPGRPENAGVCVAATAKLTGSLPILGVCLGHQAVGAAFGATVIRSRPCHGKTSEIQHDRAGLFRAQRPPFIGCRYHSLALERDTMPADLRVDAWTTAGDVMAIRHRSAPTFGLQFHPESFLTPEGDALLARFLELSR